MATEPKKPQPIIIKRVKKGAHGHHGGAWKIAYADFVTAMMAFFLLMWLLGSTTDGDRKGIADYFNTPLSVALMRTGSATGDGSHILKGGGPDITRTEGEARRADIDLARKALSPQALKQAYREAEAQRLGALKARIEAALTQNPRLAPYRSQIRLDITPDGLRIQIIDDQNRPMFDTGSALVKDYMREILREIGSTLRDTEHKVSLAGHTDAAGYSRGERGYSNWELSADRANASRRELVAGGLSEGQVARVLGLASSSPLDRGDAFAAQNRRISIIVMNLDAEERLEASGELNRSEVPLSSIEPRQPGGNPGGSSPGAPAR